MKIRQLMLCTYIALAISCSGQPPADFVQRTQELVNQAWEQGFFSGSIGIAKNGKFIYNKHYGYADWNNKKHFSDTTVFDIGSFNKDYTKEMIHQLANEGKLTLDDKLSKHLSLFGNEDDDKITIRQLLEMKSGLGDYTQAPGFIKREKEGNLTLQDRIAFIKKQPLHFEPGKSKKYSNSGYAVLGAIIEKATGKSYDQNLKERILIPLGLTQTFYTKEDIRNQQSRALGTEINFKGEKKVIDDVWSDAAPDGGIYASMPDLLHFISTLYEGKLPSGTKYPVHPLAGGSNYWNTVVVPFEDGTTVLIMSNLGDIADELGRRVYEIGKGKTPPPLKKPKEMEMFTTLKEKGIGYIENNIKSIVKEFDLPYDSRFLNFFGYKFLNGGDMDAAISMFELNTKLFPEVANTYDSLAEGWLMKGDKNKAIYFYKKALQVDPKFENAKQKLKELEKEGRR